jgi:L-fuconolactonase
MISVPRVIDTHRHVWDTRLRRYPWLDEEPSMPQGHLPSDAEDPRVSAAVFVEAGTENGVDEARWVQALADSGQWPQLVGIVAAAPVDDPAALSAVLDDLQVLPLFVGVRRLLQDEPPGTLASAPFKEGLVELGAKGVPFDACIRSRQLIELAGLVAGAPGTRIVLDHLGKPPVAAGFGSAHARTWLDDLRRLAELPNVCAKLSGLAPEADPTRPLDPQVTPFIEAALDIFGPDRLMAGSDWPVSSIGGLTSFGGWFALVARLAGTAGHADAVLRGTALRTYGLDFDRVGAAFEETGAVGVGLVGSATARRMDQRSLVDFAVDSMARNRL